MVSIAEQIKCVKREIAMRKSAYPKWIASGRMKQDAADREIAAMEAVLETLEVFNSVSRSLWTGRRDGALTAMKELFDKCERGSGRQGDNESSWDYDKRVRDETEAREGIKGWDL